MDRKIKETNFILKFYHNTPLIVFRLIVSVILTVSVICLFAFRYPEMLIKLLFLVVGFAGIITSILKLRNSGPLLVLEGNVIRYYKHRNAYNLASCTFYYATPKYRLGILPGILTIKQDKIEFTLDLLYVRQAWELLDALEERTHTDIRPRHYF